MMARWVVIAIVVGAALFAFFARRSPERPFGMSLGQDLRGGTTLRFGLDVAAARRANRIAPDETDAEIVDKTIDVIQERVNRYGLAEINLLAIGDDKFEISIP